MSLNSHFVVVFADAAIAIAVMVLAWPQEGIQMNLTKLPTLPNHLQQLLQQYGYHVPNFQEDAGKGEL